MVQENNRHRLNKVMTEKEAVSTFLKEGGCFTVGGFLANRESDCVFREIARQGIKHLQYIEESSTFSIDMLIGLGLIDRFDTAYIPHRQVGQMDGLPCLQRCFNTGDPRPVKMGGVLQTPDYTGNEKPMEIVDWSNFMVALRYVAGALNIPFMPCKSGFGTDLLKYNTELKVINDPFENKPLVLVPAIKPDVAFITVQRADRKGNGQVFGYKGTDEWKARAAKHVVLYAEELVSSDKIKQHPSHTLIPSYCTDAVVVQPYSSHPFSTFGVHGGDGIQTLNTIVPHQTKEGFEAWMKEWVFGVKDHFEYCEKIGWEKLEQISKTEKKNNVLP
jgi:glutaconate CoA-transferase subunit A